MKEDVGRYMGDMGGSDLDIVPAPGAELEPGVELLSDKEEERRRSSSNSFWALRHLRWTSRPSKRWISRSTHQAAEEKEKQGLGPTFADDEEEAEDKRSGWSKRTLRMYQLLKQHMKHVDSFGYESLVKGRKPRCGAAGII